MTTQLTGRTAVVTGTAHGIGAGIAAALADKGAVVHGVDKDTIDLTSVTAVREFFAALGGTDILVNNAGGVCGQVGRPLDAQARKACRHRQRRPVLRGRGILLGDRADDRD